MSILIIILLGISFKSKHKDLIVNKEHFYNSQATKKQEEKDAVERKEDCNSCVGWPQGEYKYMGVWDTHNNKCVAYENGSSNFDFNNRRNEFIVMDPGDPGDPGEYWYGLKKKDDNNCLTKKQVDDAKERVGRVKGIVEKLTGIYETIETNNITITSIKESYNSYKSELSSIKTRLRNIKPKLIDNIKQKIDNINDYQYVGLNYHGLNKNINNLDDLLNILTEHNTKIKTIKKDEEEMNTKYETKIEENTIDNLITNHTKQEADARIEIKIKMDENYKEKVSKEAELKDLNHDIKYSEIDLQQLKKDIKEISIKHDSLIAQTSTSQASSHEPQPHNNFTIKAIPGNEQIKIIWDKDINNDYNYDLYIFDKNDVKKIHTYNSNSDANYESSSDKCIWTINGLFNGIQYGIKIKRKEISTKPNHDEDEDNNMSNTVYAIPLNTIRDDSARQTNPIYNDTYKDHYNDNSLINNFIGREFEINLG